MSTKKFNRVMVANRGEIAIRIFRALSELSIQTICVFSKEDKYSLFRTKADESYILNRSKGPIDAYLDMEEIIRIAKTRNVDAIHPGYGFLSENPEFVKLCKANNIAFIGPDAESMELMGDKISSKKIAIACGVPIIPGIDRAISSLEEMLEIAETIGYPVMLKASNGGGGRGMRIVHSKEEMPKEFAEAKEESRKAFGEELIFIEKYLKDPKHIEIQVLADQHGNLVHLFDRDCSVQRRHQKVIEYAPAFTLSEETRQKMFADAVKLSKHVNYKNAGTLEFLVDEEENYYFIEMNPRIQVEHTVTEEITGIDIVQSQILIAQGYTLDSPEIGIANQEAIQSRGYSIQCRVTSEDPANNFFPDTGKLNVYRSASGFGIRLDGGNGFTGSEITPFYDSLVVKVIARALTFEGAVKKAQRSLVEMRVRGVKTNIPFLTNVLKNDIFREGRATTTFIESNPSLLELKIGQDRATKLMGFIGNIIVNETNGPKPAFDPVSPPRYDREKTIWGARDEFLSLGARDFAQKILKEKKLYVTDTTMRDAHQSLFATRMRTNDLLGAARATNACFAPAFSVEAWGGATFDVAYRFLKESPWVRLEQLRQRMPNTLIQMLLRASNAVGYASYPDNIVKEFIKVSSDRGIDVFRIFDSLNWIENMKMPVKEALNMGKLVEGAICYTGDLSSPTETKYTLDYYVEKAKELEAMGVHIFTIKDMAGLLKPYAAKVLVETLKAELSIPVNLHTHDTTGNGVSSVLMATSAGLDIADLAVESMSGLTSQPSMNAVVEALSGTDRDTGLDADALTELSRYYGEIRKRYEKFESGMTTPNTEIYKYEIPGGQYSNLLAQAKELGAGEDFEQIKVLYKEANDLLGNIVKVTPSSKAVGDMAIFMLKNGLDINNILEQGKHLSFPSSVVEYFQGMMGQPDGGFPKELQKIVLKNIEPITVRPGSLLPAQDFDEIRDHLDQVMGRRDNDRNILSYALYPKVYEDYCKHVDLYHDVTRLASNIFFYGLEKGEEATIKIETGKYLIVKYLDASAPNAQGKRTLAFEVNGSVREVEVLDKKLEIKAEKKLTADKTNPLHVGSPIPGKISKILVDQGDAVVANSPLMTVEAMKMETTVVSSAVGIVGEILVTEGDMVAQNELILTFEKQ